MLKSKNLLVSGVMAIALLAVVLVGMASAKEPDGSGPMAPAAPLGFVTATIPYSQVVNVGDTFLVPIAITGAVDMTAFDFTIEFTPTVVTVTGWIIGKPGFGPGGGIVPDNWIDLGLGYPAGNQARPGASAGFPTVTPINGDGILGWITVTAQAAGSSKLDLIDGLLTKSDFSTISPPDLDLFGGWVTVVDQPIAGLAAANDSPTILSNPTNFTATVTAGTGVTYAWDFGDGIGTGVGANPAYTYPDPGIYTAIVTASNTAGSMVDTTVVEVHEPIAGLNANDSSPTDVGSLVNFTATITSDPTGVTYAWDFGDSVGTGAGANPSYTYGAVGAYTATVTATNALGPVVATTLVDIQDIPIAGLTASNDSPTPLGNLTHFTATITAGTGVTYAWDFGDGTGAGVDANPVYTYTNFGNLAAIVTATNSRGWLTATTAVTITSDPDILVVPPSLSETLDPNETNTQILTIHNVGGDDLNWSNLTENPVVGWLSETPLSGSAPVPPGGSNNVTVTFDSTGLTPGVYPTTLRITSNDPDEPTVNVPVTLTVNCVEVTDAYFVRTPPNPRTGDVVTFTAGVTPSNATPPIVYTWDFDGDGTPEQSGVGLAVVTYSWGFSGTYHVVMTATNCITGEGTDDDHITVPGDLDITVVPLSLSAMLNPGDVTTRTLIISNAPTATANLNWSLAENPPAPWLDEAPGGGTLLPAGSDTVNVVFTAGLVTDTYTTTLQVSSNDPDEPQVAVSVTLVVTTACIEVEGADFTYEPPAPQAGGVITFTGSVTRGTEFITYTWDFGGVTATGRIVTHTWGFSGTYSVMMTATNACGEDPATYDVPVTGEPDISVDPLSLSVLLETGGSTTRILTITNASTATANLNWSLAEVPDVAWLNEAPDSGTALQGESDTVGVNFTANVGAGTHNTILRVNSNDPDEPQVDVNVTLIVTSCVPVSDADFTWSADPLVGETVTFTGTVDPNTSTWVEFLWDFGDGSDPESDLQYGTTSVVQHTYAVSRTYHVVMTATNDCPSEDTAEDDVVVMGEPDISVNPLSLNVVMNPGDMLKREITLHNASTATANLAWSVVETPAVPWLDENPTSGVISPSESGDVIVTFDTAPNPGFGVHTTTLQIRSNDLDDSPVDVDIALTVNNECNPLDEKYVDFDFAPTGPFTPPQTVVFTASVMQGSLPFDYIWDFGDGSAPEVHDNENARTLVTSHSYTDEKGGYVVKLTVRSNCDDSQVVVSKNVGKSFIYLPLVVRNYAPCVPVNVTALDSDSPVTLGEAMHFTATVEGTETIIYTWDFDGAGSGSGTDGATPAYTYDVTGTYTVTLDVENACGTDSDTITVTVCDPVNIVALDSDSPVVMGEAMHFTATVTGDTPIIYTWDFGGAGTQDGTDTNPIFTYDAADTYTVTLVVTNACGTDSDFVTVMVSSAVGANFIPSTPPVSEITTLTTGIIPSNAVAAYAWNAGGRRRQ